MSYDYSFQKGQLWLLGTLSVLMATLLVITGFLIGRITMTPPDTMVAGGAGVVAAPGTVVSSARPAASGANGVSVALPQVGGGYVASPTRVVIPMGSGSTAAPAAAPVAATPAPVEVTSVASSSAAATASSGAAVGADVYTLGSPGYTLQYGAFRDPSNARELMKQLAEQKVIASSVTMTNAYGQAFSVVRSGAYPTISDAREAAVEQANKLRMPIVVRPASKL